MKYFVGILLLLLIVFHQDYWQWDKSDLLFGFLPYALGYHMVISLVTAFVWLLAVTFAWPKGLNDESPANGGDQ